jgi:hypothetical protein
LGTIAIWDDDRLVFADLRSPGTVANLRGNPSVEVNVVDQLVRKGYRLKGTGRAHRWRRVRARGAVLRTAGLERARERIHSIVLITVERVLAVTSPAYDVGASEDEPRAIYRERLRL